MTGDPRTDPRPIPPEGCLDPEGLWNADYYAHQAHELLRVAHGLNDLELVERRGAADTGDLVAAAQVYATLCSAAVVREAQDRAIRARDAAIKAEREARNRDIIMRGRAGG